MNKDKIVLKNETAVELEAAASLEIRLPQSHWL